jgi:hypothetical protein
MDPRAYRQIYEIRDARLVVLLAGGGGAVVESGLALSYEEGRIYDEHRDDLSKASTLSRYASFSVVGQAEPNKLVGAHGQMVITGTLASGGWIEIRGSGSLYYSEHGTPEGEFDDLPEILVEPSTQEPAQEDPSWNVDDWMARMSKIEPRPSAEFDRACAGRRLADLPADDI